MDLSWIIPPKKRDSRDDVPKPYFPNRNGENIQNKPEHVPWTLFIQQQNDRTHISDDHQHYQCLSINTHASAS